MPRKMVTVEDRDMEEVQETSTPWDPKTPLGLLPGRLGVNEEPSDESESDSEREPVNWRGRQTQRSWPKTEPAMVTPTDHVRAEQRWKWARMLRDTGLTFSGAKDKLGAETFLARLERYRTKGAIPQEDMLFAVDALLVGEAQVLFGLSTELQGHEFTLRPRILLSRLTRFGNFLYTFICLSCWPFTCSTQVPETPFRYGASTRHRDESIIPRPLAMCKYLSQRRNLELILLFQAVQPTDERIVCTIALFWPCVTFQRHGDRPRASTCSFPERSNK
ncbi:unnamed protein product [Trichogramma brassicae]|uniref:Uncharacterized protein n=1 Tax=Trichogramma brassicae TaxID=86971 RepID=A0A6H5ILT8_9HYME|nr:unnamed protein product [Trichogramma brassicae]